MPITKINIDDDKTVGRLGNKLFIVAAGYSFSKMVGGDFVLPHWKYEKFFRNIPVADGIRVDKTYPEKEFTYRSPVIDNLRGNVSLDGYFQSHKYFHSRESILDLLTISCDIPLDDDIKTRTAIHVRRGDYMKVSHVHFNLSSTDYYSRAMASFDDKRFVVFSDDIDFCKQFFSGTGYDIRYSSGTTEIEDLYLMSNCKHNIIANSSFSWWGAYLNRNGGIVIMPRQWFTNDCVDSRDLSVPGWKIF